MFLSQFSQSLLARGSWFFLFYERIHLIMDESLLMLITLLLFYEMTHRPYILELYISDIFFLSSLFLSSFHLSLIRILFYLASQLITSELKIRLVFLCLCKVYAKKDFSCYKDITNILSWLLLCIQIMRSNELVISVISY